MGNLVFFDEKIFELNDVRMKCLIVNWYIKQFCFFSGFIVECGNKVGKIRINEDLDVFFCVDFCEIFLMGLGFFN